MIPSSSHVNRSSEFEDILSGNIYDFDFGIFDDMLLDVASGNSKLLTLGDCEIFDFHESSNLCSDPSSSYSSPSLEDEYDTLSTYCINPDEVFYNPMKVLIKNCKITGCDSDCAKVHSNGIISDDIESKYTPYCDVKPYTPDYDHCYSRKNERDIDEQQLISPSCIMDKSGEDDVDDIIDVVTVPDEYRPEVNPKSVMKSTRSIKNSKQKKKRKRALTFKNVRAVTKRTCMTEGLKTLTLRSNNTLETNQATSIHWVDDEENGKRANHNTSERKRREAQRDALQYLRKCVPSVENDEKASKVRILDRATEHIKKLKNEQLLLKAEKGVEKKKNKKLIKRLRKMVQELNLHI